MGKPREFLYVGKDTPRVDAFEKITGTAKFTLDMKLPAMLHAKALKSPHAHARILSVDTSKAKRLQGVKAVLTGQDTPYKVGIFIADRDILARGKVHWVGEPVAAVAAVDEVVAEEAVELIDVRYEVLKPVFDPREALGKDAPLVHENLHEFTHSAVFSPVPHTNIANHFRLRKGDVKKGFDEADVILENEFLQPEVNHVPMETHTSIGQYLPDGRINIWTSTQSPFAVRFLLGVSLGVPMYKINVNVPYVGGGFGGKAGINFEPLVVLLSKKAGGRPVKLELTREEEFTTAPVRQGMYARIKTGAKTDGKLTAHEIDFIWDAGAYADYGVNVGRAAGYACTGPYEVPNVKCDSLTVYTNHPYGGAFRGFGHFELLWVVERQMDMVARRIGMDPVEFRLKNALRPGSFTATGERLREDAGRVDECIQAVAEGIGWGKKTDAKEPGKSRGKGIAALWKAPAMPPNTASSVILKFNEDSSVNLVLGLVEIGQGTTTAMAQMVAEELGLPVEKVNVVLDKSTDLSPYSWQTVASRSIFMDGNALLAAAEDAKEQIKSIASQALRVPKDDLVLADERVFVAGRPDVGLPLREVVMGYSYPNGNSVGGPVVGRGTYIARGLTNLDPETGQGLPALMWTFGAHAVEVEVDRATWELRVLKVVSAYDVGKAINPQLVRSQVYGGVVQALGIALMEDYVYDEEGLMLNSNLTDYKTPRVADIPDEHSVILVENPQSDAPYGARGVAELAMLAVAPAVANALYDAVGVDIMKLPMSPEKIWKAVREKGGGR